MCLFYYTGDWVIGNWWLVCDSLAIGALKGRKTGKAISTPVNVIPDGHAYIVLSTRNRSWWRNLKNGASAQLHIGGQDFTVQGEIIEEKKEVIGGISSMIPTSLALAQSILETGYGKSYAARSKHNHFGLSKRGKLKKFESAHESVTYYLETLRNHFAYEKFRDLLIKGVKSPFVLISQIAPAYAEDKKYSRRIQSLISACDLERFDSV